MGQQNKNQYTEIILYSTGESILKYGLQYASYYMNRVGVGIGNGIVYQTITDLHEAIPNHKGDWYFTGDYPTPGGNKVVNRAFINYIEGRNVRAY